MMTKQPFGLSVNGSARKMMGISSTLPWVDGYFKLSVYPKSRRTGGIVAEVKISTTFAESADHLPKEAKMKLWKVVKLLTDNPMHPSLQLKKIKGSVRDDVYECRLDRFWRLVLQDLGNMLFQLIYVGAHDEAINYGAMVRESGPIHSGYAAPLDRIKLYLGGDDGALTFVSTTLVELERLLTAASGTSN